MSKLKLLREITSKPELAKLMGIAPVFLTKCLYVIRPEHQYHQFQIDKKSGGKRTISAPSEELKSLQKKLSLLLLDCLDEINSEKFPYSQAPSPKKRNHGDDYSANKLKIKIPSAETKQPSLSHGFERNRSIITNAMMHIGKKNILNIDLADFFDQFNFGRVRGFFIKNKYFNLDPHIATVIAQIACYDNKLPQGSPSSPVITNLITHSLDIRLLSLAKKYKCNYTRYADDLTFSTRLDNFPEQIMKQVDGEYIPSSKLLHEITRSGFTINNKKTRIQFKNSRQDVTGLVVNKKPNVKSEYWRQVRAKCNSLFKTGEFFSIKNGEIIEGNINELQGQLNFIDQVDLYNRLRQKPPLQPEFELKKLGTSTKQILSSRERTFSQFLFYRLFFGNDRPTILCEGKTDNVYLKSAINSLKADYPSLARMENGKYNLLINFVEYSKRTKFLLELYGGANYLRDFILNYEKNFKIYKNHSPKHPVMIFLDNDSGANTIINLLRKEEWQRKISLSPNTLDKKDDIRKSNFIHVEYNLYVILTPRSPIGDNTDIEYFFDDKTRLLAHSNGKCFNTVSKRNPDTDLSKEAFATHIIKEKKNSIDFTSMKPLLNLIVDVVTDYNTR